MMVEAPGRFVSSHRDFYAWLGALYADPELTPAQKAVGARIALHLNLNEGDPRKGQCNPAVKTIAKGTALTERGVQKARERLVASGWIVVTGQGGAGAGDSNRYDLVMTTVPTEIRANGSSPTGDVSKLRRVNGSTNKGEPANIEGRTPVHPNSKNYTNSGKPSAVGAPDGADRPTGMPLGVAIDHEIRKRLSKEGLFESWFRNLSIFALADRIVTIAAPTAFSKHKIETQFGDQLLGAVRAVYPTVERVNIVVITRATGPPPAALRTRPAAKRV